MFASFILLLLFRVNSCPLDVYEKLLQCDCCYLEGVATYVYTLNTGGLLNSASLINEVFWCSNLPETNKQTNYKQNDLLEKYSSKYSVPIRFQLWKEGQNLKVKSTKATTRNVVIKYIYYRLDVSGF
jgi:hypothetical protein